MPSKFLIDSDVIIWFLRGRKETIELFEKLEKSGIPVCSPISIIEVQRGVKIGEQEKTSAFLNSLEVYPIDGEIATKAGEFLREFKEKGIVLEIPDAIIGATAVLNDLILVSYNQKHYPFREIKLYRI